MKGTFPCLQFERLATPFYYYDTQLLRDTLKEINRHASQHDN